MGISHLELLESMEKIAPQCLMEEWDNVGVQIKVSDEPINRILVALEITEAVMAEAASSQANLIITHHPLIFDGIRHLTVNDLVGKYVISLISQGISVYAAHTNFDKAPGGNNDFLIDLLGVPYNPVIGTGSFGNGGIGRMLDLTKFEKLENLAAKVQRSFDIPEGELRQVGRDEQLIHRIGVCTGAGASLIKEAISNGCNLLITGDVKYHDAQYAKEMGFCLIDAGHFHTEKFFAGNYAERLKRVIGEKVLITASQININPFGY